MAPSHKYGASSLCYRGRRVQRSLYSERDYCPPEHLVYVSTWCLFNTLTPFDRAILHDSTAYPDPLAFKPQRFEDPEASRRNNPLPNAAFGYGRRYDCIFTWNVSPYIDALNRMCPGRWLAWDSIWIAVASILKVYNISPIAPDLLVRYFDSSNTYSRISPY